MRPRGTWRRATSSTTRTWCRGGRAFVELFKSQRKPAPVLPLMRMPVISIIAERDIVMVSSVRKVRDRQKPDHVYFITWFDVFRIDEQGLIAEHWDPSETWVDGKPPGAEFFGEIFPTQTK